MTNNLLLDVYTQQFTKSYKTSDRSHWHAALWASRIVGTYERGETLSMAKANGVSVDTVEDHAHAYRMFTELCSLSTHIRLFTFSARRAPYIHYSHFRALWDAKEKYSLTLDECFSMLMDIVQAEGDISSRDIDKHASDRYGKEPTWEFKAQKAMKALHGALITLPEEKSDGRKVLSDAYEWIGANA